MNNEAEKCIAATGAPTPTDMWEAFPIQTGGILTLFIVAPLNGS